MQLYQIPSVSHETTRKALYLLSAAGMEIPDAAVIGASILRIVAGVDSSRLKRDRPRAIMQAFRLLGAYAGGGRYVVVLDTRDLLKTKVHAASTCTFSDTYAFCSVEDRVDIDEVTA